MSTDSFAVFRKSLGPDLSALAEQHMQHDLQPSDRAALQSAARTVSTHAGIGSVIGITLGTLLAYRLRRSRARVFAAIRASERPTSVRFADGREETLPDLTRLMRPSSLGNIATYAFLGAGGVFVGGELGLLSGSFRARQLINADRESRARIETAFRRFQADALRTQANLLDRQGGEDGEGAPWRM